MVLRDVRYWGVETVQAGYALAELEAAEAAPLAALASRWKRVEGPVVDPHPHVVLGFDLLANHLANPLNDPLRHLDRVKADSQLAQVPDRYGAFLEARIHWIGPYAYPPEKPSMQRCFVVISVPPGLDPRPFLKPILEEARRAGVRVLREAAAGPTGASPYPTAFTDILRNVTEAYSPGVPFGPMPTFGGYTTSVLFRERGFPTYGYSPIAMNITDSVRRHSNDERVFLRDYLRGCEIYSDVVEEFASRSPVGEVSPPSAAK
jgi:hypothetical protein